MDRTESQEVVIKSISYTRQSLEPIKEQSISSCSDSKSRSKGSIRNKSKTSSTRNSKCPTTHTECPTKVALAKLRQHSQSSDASYGEKRSYNSLLKQPFIFRHASSLQRAVEQNTETIDAYLKTDTSEAELEEASRTGSSVFTSNTTVSIPDTQDRTETKSQTEESEIASYNAGKRRVEYLLGISPHGGEESVTEDVEKIIVDEALEKPVSGETAAMKQAQRYLRVHRIFEFYQFLVAHLLSALPENPINFLLDLLDKCIVYRAGIGNPPVLYERKHLEALFNLMDRMRTGYIDKDQYVTGMKTLGICSYDPNPRTIENMVHKSFFVEEAYENLVSMLNDIIRRRWIYFHTQPLPSKTPPPTPQLSSLDLKKNLSSRR